jgi:hypothetical protein
MLLAIPGFVVIPEVMSGPFRVRRNPRNGVEFVIAEKALRAPGLNHASDDAHRLELLWPAVDQITQENGCPLGMPPDSLQRRVTELGQ